MKYKKSIIILIMVISVLLSIAGVCACDADEQALAIGDMGQIGLSQNKDNVTVTDDYLALGDGNSQNDVLAGSQDTLNSEYGNEWGSGKSIEINDGNYKEYFSESGTILENANISDNDTIILGNINDKCFDIDRPLTITSNGTVLNNIEITLNKGSDNSIIENLTIINEGDLTVIFVSEAENVTIISNKISVNSLGNDNDVCAVFANLANNLKIMDNIFKYVGRDNDVHYNSNIVLDIVESDDVLIEKNDILFDVESNATASNKVIRASQSDNLVISHNTIAAAIPSRSIDWYAGEVYSVAVSLDSCDDAVLEANDIFVTSGNSISDYDAVYAVRVLGDNASILGNEITLKGATYGYGIAISGANFTISENNQICVESDCYSCSIEVDGFSVGVISHNSIDAKGDSAYGIYTANWAGDVKVKIASNVISAEGITSFGMSLSASEASVEQNQVIADGNFTTGIASAVDSITIKNNTVDAKGSDVGTHAGYDTMGIETVGIHIVRGYATITDNNISNSGEYAIDIDGEGLVDGNYLVAYYYLGDLSVSDAQGMSTVKNNRPSMKNINISADDIELLSGEECIVCVNVTDEGGNPLSGVPLQLRVGNEIYNTTSDRNGNAVFDLGKLDVGRHNSILSTMPNPNHYLAIKKVNVVVKKVASKITAKAKTFKSSAKTKKFTITLKDSKGNSIKKAKVYLKVKGKTYAAKTNSKGKATFKITKLAKSGKYKAVVTFKGNDYYKKSTKKVKITVKSVWKTVARGSKLKTTVKNIQKALKNNGYYLSYKGHYLMVDGIFESCTERSVKEFQKDHGLKVTGKVDEKTAKILKLI